MRKNNYIYKPSGLNEQWGYVSTFTRMRDTIMTLSTVIIAAIICTALIQLITHMSL